MQCTRASDVDEKNEEVEENDEEISRSDAAYLQETIFKLLTPAVEETLIEARKWNALRIQKCRFNGLDYLAEILWNRNPRRAGKLAEWKNVFGIPEFKKSLRSHPRPLYPKSWLWSEREAVLILQRNIRGWLVRKREDVQEMRQFWMALRTEKRFANLQDQPGKNCAAAESTKVEDV